MASPEGTGRRRKAARKANGSGTIKKRKDGRYEGQIFLRTTSGEFKRVSVYGRSWDECDEKITRLKVDSYAGIGVSVGSYTVCQWLSYWLEDVVKPARKPSTYVGYEVAMRLYLVPQLGKISSPRSRLRTSGECSTAFGSNASAAHRVGTTIGQKANAGAVQSVSAANDFPTLHVFTTSSGRFERR
jgi:hypothetical protein